MSPHSKCVFCFGFVFGYIVLIIGFVFFIFFKFFRENLVLSIQFKFHSTLVITHPLDISMSGVFKIYFGKFKNICNYAYH